MTDSCRVYEVDGQPVRVRGGRPLTEQDQAALAEVARAAHQVLEQLPPEQVARQEAARERNRQRLLRLGIRTRSES